VKAAIAPLAALPGVALAMLVSQDGVPIVMPGSHKLEETTERNSETRFDDAEALAALAAGWISDISRASAPISWNPPRYVVLRAARGSLLAMQVPRALIIVVLGPGMRPADFRLPMEAAAARMERGLRAGVQRAGLAAGAASGLASGLATGTAAGTSPESITEPSGIFPERPRTSAFDVEDNESTSKNGASQPHGPTGE
jgi:predicted regulator of Ras-like GTPase activity (Roadblock/LC7/MglB family)